jgi:hypothetical protein
LGGGEQDFGEHLGGAGITGRGLEGSLSAGEGLIRLALREEQSDRVVLGVICWHGERRLSDG